MVNMVPTKPQTFFVFVEKTDWKWFATNCLRTFHKPSTNYTSITFANWFAKKMLASVYEALE